ncbi:MAG: small subunit ribosomal protein S20 [Candidatus Berkelbacteria bacterium Licking1014_96]|uniref:Small ribosomal subunit protein bS20 n=1 Tax=Candidatus Berkelbacteria bacterium Licking1014_96 TaxID=2017149 RepID=A0A554LH50_9BACT|nr:MAG: small subunit ribosomal protein S20 [Candidatus Berkelbacteria bacterium Licking1014_96]
MLKKNRSMLLYFSMPIIKSAKKRVRVAKRNQAQNLKYKNAMKKAITAYYQEKNSKKKEKKLSQAFSAIDKAVKINLIHKNKAARLKSKLAKSPEKKIVQKRKTAKKVKKAKKK